MQKVNCIICGSSESEEIFRNCQDKHFAKIDYLKGKPSIVVMCKRCGLAYHNPRLDSKELHLIYPRLYRPPRPSVDYLTSKLNNFQERADWLEAHLQDKNHNSYCQLLDIGCAEGSSLYVFKKRGWQTFGIEPSESFSEFGRKEWGLNISTGFFSANIFKDVRFDVISIIRVLEHISDPGGLLEVARNKLNPAGLFFIEVPNLRQPRNNLKKHFFNSTTLYIFTISTLSNLLKKVNLVIKDYVLVNGGIRVLAKPASFKENRVFLREDSPFQIKRIIFKHRMRWFLAAELKLSKLPLKSFFKIPSRFKNRIF